MGRSSTVDESFLRAFSRDLRTEEKTGLLYELSRLLTSRRPTGYVTSPPENLSLFTTPVLSSEAFRILYLYLSLSLSTTTSTMMALDYNGTGNKVLHVRRSCNNYRFVKINTYQLEDVELEIKHRRALGFDSNRPRIIDSNTNLISLDKIQVIPGLLIPDAYSVGLLKAAVDQDAYARPRYSRHTNIVNMAWAFLESGRSEGLGVPENWMVLCSWGLSDVAVENCGLTVSVQSL
ncbi:hypothetical protein WH47_05495 [Habropoda laboriosa]|uniref:Uncharacterized protein n=1 Tax=Habropoda laboriosa TaxID=597456 RepID=A0A0L7REZ1_9HYME|nr:hypothetical protein WH47_05495 [Habropoda laboriosa]